MNKTTTETPDEQGHEAIAKQVITQKRRYFFPDQNKTVEVEVTDDDNDNMRKAVAAAEKEQ